MFQTLLFVVIFLTGLIIGSFLNCVIYRLTPHHFFVKSGRGLKGRSFCPHCKHILSWQDLIPVFSFIFLKGKCRYCQKPISLQYPLVELATGILFLLASLMVSLKLEFATMVVISSIYWWLMICFLIVIFVYDLKYYIIPDQIVYPAIALAFLYQVISNFPIGPSPRAIGQFSISITNFPSLTTNFYLPVLSAVIAAGFFLLIVLISRGRCMGVGDIKLAFLMGLMLGFPNILVALFLAFFTGAIVGSGLIILNRKTLKSEIPFGPFLISGTFLSLFWGTELINWYQGLFLSR